MNKASNNNNLYYSIVKSEYLNVAHLQRGYFYPPPTHYSNREGYISKPDNIVTYQNNPEPMPPNIYQLIYFLKTKKHKLPQNRWNTSNNWCHHETC